MMPVIARLIGGAGTGKTAEMMRILDKALDPKHSDIVDPRQVGVVSLTRAARHEASHRAADRFELNPKELEHAGWFRTLHSTCKKLLSVGGELLTNNKEARTWLEEALQEDVSGTGETENGEPDVFSERQDADTALGFWHTARNRLTSLSDVWEAAYRCDERIPDCDYCTDIVERYEQMKRLDGRCDFTDLLAKFGGWYCTVDGAEKCEPDGKPVDLPIWFHDEMQDVSRLSCSVFDRLIAQPSVKWVYLAGDPFQAIYGWSGADHRCFLNYPKAKSRVMPQSWRCPSEILALGELILSDCSDYWDRKIAPARHEGSVEESALSSRTIGEIDPRVSWLVLARTNFQARRLAKMLDTEGIPWVPTRGRGGWNAPVRNEAIKALLSIEAGAPIDGGQWQEVLKTLPCRVDGLTLFTRGTKLRFSDMEDAQGDYPWVQPDELESLGGTDAFRTAVRSGEWRTWIDGVDAYDEAARQWGEDAVEKPLVKVGTIHSVKGGEADNVLLLSTVSMPTVKAMGTDDGFDAEQRVWYVAVTRARKRLVIMHERKPRFRKRLV